MAAPEVTYYVQFVTFPVTKNAKNKVEKSWNSTYLVEVKWVNLLRRIDIWQRCDVDTIRYRVELVGDVP